MLGNLDGVAARRFKTSSPIMRRFGRGTGLAVSAAICLSLTTSVTAAAPTANGQPKASKPRDSIVPLVSYHQHLLSHPVREMDADHAPIAVKDLIKQMDDAGIKRAVVLPVIVFHRPISQQRPNEYAEVKAENDWIVKQVSLYPDRLVAFCGINPIADYAVKEVERCSKLPHVKGLKINLFNSGVDVRSPFDVEKVRRFFEAANKARLAVVVHHWARDADFRRESQIFLDQFMPMAPDIVVQIAHMAGKGSRVFVDAIQAGDPRVKNLYFDFGGVSDRMPQEMFDEWAERMRKIGLTHVLFGSDLAPAPPPGEAWATFRKRIPLDDTEIRTIANNVAPYLR